ncbi:MAG: type II toxin-antitoxin system PemK/MazF family toxin [Bryobacterales bacterium]|nr:type II toxin-antitoxin system PemK/MazF family toxin [Bryobacterales bacterium]
MNRGDVYWADLSPRSGSEQSGRRPVIVVSHDAFNKAAGWHSFIVVPVSTSLALARRGPTAVRLDEAGDLLPRPSVALCHQVTTLDRAKLRQRIGALPVQVLRSVEAGLKKALDLD